MEENNTGNYKENNTGKKTGMSRLWELALRKKALVICACVLAVFSIAASFVPFIAMYYIIRELCLPAQAQGPGVLPLAKLQYMNNPYMLRMGWLAAGGAVGAIALNFLALMCSHIAAFTTMYGLKLEFTSHIAALPLGFHSANSTGKLRKVVDENIEKLEGFIAHQLPDLAGSFAMPAITLVILFAFDWRLGLASLVPVIIAYGIQMTAMGNRKSRIFIEKYQNSLEEMNNASVEYVRGISVVKAFNQTIFSFRKFHETIVSYGRFVKNYTLSFEKHMAAFMVIINHVYLFLIPVIILLAGGVPPSAAGYAQFALASVFYLIFSFSLTAPFTKLMFVSQSGRQIADGIARMDKVLDQRPLRETTAPKAATEYSVAFENVTFYYGGEASPRAPARQRRSSAAPLNGGSAPVTPPPALSNVSFTARQGEVTALVGPSGSGKSTIAHLIPRFYDAWEGAVKIGGVDIRDMAQYYLMSIVGFVFQDVFLFRQSIADNILIGKKSASMEQVIAAAKAARCHEFIQKLPRRYDTVIGAGGVHLSGGEAQRIVIARAILKNPPILVLDEATAFADPENERDIQLALSELIKDKTVIIIAHRLSTVRGADKIIVVEKGRIVEEGRHDALAAGGGLYSRMWERCAGALNWTLAKKEAPHVWN